MKDLPDTKTLLELLQSAKEVEEKARTLYEIGVELRKELETKLEKRQKFVESPPN